MRETFRSKNPPLVVSTDIHGAELLTNYKSCVFENKQNAKSVFVVPHVSVEHSGTPWSLIAKTCSPGPVL